MGVVRREGEWRLEKREAGHYEVTYQRKSQVKVITPDYSPGMMDDVSFTPLTVHEVDSYAEVKGVFEEYAHGDPPVGMVSFGGGSSSSIGSGGDGDLGNLPPGGIALAFLLAGGVVISISGFAPGEPNFLLGAGMVGVGAVIVAWAAFLFHTQGWREAVEFLITVDEEESSTTETSSSTNDSSDGTETTPQAPESLKNELIFGRAKQECEWCGDHLDNPEVHHIKPRSEGGPNEPNNLIVLCPTCHRKADRGGISRTKLRGKLRHILSEER